MKVIEVLVLKEQILNLSASALSSKIAYKLFKIKKTFNKLFSDYIEEESEFLKEIGISKEDIGEKGEFKDTVDSEKIIRFKEYKEEALQKEITIEIEMFTFDEMFEIIKENELPINAELALEDKIWKED